MKNNLLIADLFCGAGGSSTGAERAVKELGAGMILVCVCYEKKKEKSQVGTSL